MTARTARDAFALGRGQRTFILVMLPLLLGFGLADVFAGHPWIGSFCLFMFAVQGARLIASQVSR